MNGYLDESIAAPIILGLVEVFKQVGLPSKFSPLLACVFGILYGLFVSGAETIAKGVMVGLIEGLAASGLYSGTKNVTQQLMHHQGSDDGK